MKVYETEEVKQEIVKDIICDCCGKSCFEICDYEYAQLRATWGYGSHRDTEQWNCDLCEQCSDKVKKYIEELGGKITVNYY